MSERDKWNAPISSHLFGRHIKAVDLAIYAGLIWLSAYGFYREWKR